MSCDVDISSCSCCGGPLDTICTWGEGTGHPPAHPSVVLRDDKRLLTASPMQGMAPVCVGVIVEGYRPQTGSDSDHYCTGMPSLLFI